MIDSELKTFILLKYEILTSDSDTWKRCEATYPDSVKSKWAWRCASDVEHHAKGYPEAEKCIKIAKLYRDGAATIEELKKAWNKVPYTVRSAAYAAGATYTAASTSSVAVTAYYVGLSATTAAYYASGAGVASTAREEKWKLYIQWLIEELCEYERLQGEL